MAFSVTEWLKYITLMQVFWGNGIDLQSAFAPLNAVYWTLPLEVQFYCIVGFAVLCKSYNGHFLVLITGAGLIAACLPKAYTIGLFPHIGRCSP
jgi:peptidoglycan/LPS O-acetylase OafA/YrhL